jgi:hypothetical protein
MHGDLATRIRETIYEVGDNIYDDTFSEDWICEQNTSHEFVREQSVVIVYSQVLFNRGI